MTAADLASICSLLARSERWDAALERLRALLALPSLVFVAESQGRVAPAGQEQTRWRREVVWEDKRLGWLEADAAPADSDALEQLLPLVAWAKGSHAETASAKELVAEVRSVASSALDFSEFVTWLLHATDERDAERLGIHAVLTLLKAEDGALLRRERDGWVLRIPARDISVPVTGVEQGTFKRLFTRADVELEYTLDAAGDDVERALTSWGFTHTFAVALDSGDELQGVLFALSKVPLVYSPTARISATQLAILMSVALDRFAQHRKLHEHQRALEDALRIAHMGSWELSLATREMTWSPELNRIFGGPFERRTLSSSEAISSMNADEQILELLQVGETTTWSSEVKTLDGRTIWTRSSCELLAEPDGSATRIRGVTRDVTIEVWSQLERERALNSLRATTERLEKSEAQLRQAGAIARIGAWSMDITSDTLTWSDEVRRILEVPDDFVAKPDDAARFYDPESLARLQAASREALTHGTPFDLELQVITWTNKRLFARHQGNAEFVDGVRARLVGAFQDVTEQRMAREAAVEASRVKSQFLANTSHEIRTPLNGIIGMTRLALETNLSSEQREYLDAVRISSDNLLAIVNDILDISKIESGKLEVERAPFSLRQTVYEAARNQASRAHVRDLELVVDFDPALAEQYYGDAVRVSQITTNLIGNAVKFTERGQVVVEARKLSDGIEIVVNDTGVGIPSDRIEHIFEAFTQADGATNRRFGGTGLGLTITLQLVKRMGGRIEVESTVGKGSCFRTFLPLVEVGETPRRLAMKRGTALVVSDREASRNATSRQLTQLGFDIVASSSKMAMHALLDLPEAPRLVVIDHELDGTTGVELSEALQLEQSLSVVPRLLLVRTTARPPADALTAAGVRRVLSRPTALSELQHAVQQIERGEEQLTREPKAERVVTRRKLKLLLAEDNPINARLAQRLCERLGHEVRHVVNGALAVEAAHRESWDAILMDMHMPELDGIEATRRIRSVECDHGRRSVPIVAVTASAMKGDDQFCLAAGMDAYLTKPLDPDRLAELLEEVADGVYDAAPTDKAG